MVSGFGFSADDIAELLNLVRGLPSKNLDEERPDATGIRDLEGTRNNIANPEFGSADQVYVRLTEAHYGALDGNNRAVDPIHSGLDPREISNILADQEAGLPVNGEGANVFFNAFGQYFDHGLGFLPKGGFGSIAIGGGSEVNLADLTRGTVDHIDADDVPQHLNKTSPPADQNQTYGSTELVGQFLRESDGNGGFGARLLAGAPDPTNPEFDLLPSLRDLILHHWNAETVFEDAGVGENGTTLLDFYPDLVDIVTGEIDLTSIESLVGNFLGSGHAIFLDVNPFINLEDHLVAGDGRTNENYTLTAIHTVWAREHNSLVQRLDDAGFAGSSEELFQAAKIVNVAQYQSVVFDEYADALLGGLRGSGKHGFDDYNRTVDSQISHEFAAAAFRIGHSMLAETVTVLDENGEPMDVRLFDVFLNPTNDPDAFTMPIADLNAFGYFPQPGTVQLGIAPILGGIVTQPAEENDVNVVDAVRDDLVRIQADLAAFGIARGWDVGLGTLNQIRRDLIDSTDPYVVEAVSFAGDLTPYTSWDDFQDRNGLSDTVIDQFKQAYPDLDLDTLSQADQAAFALSNAGIALVDGHIVMGIDRVDLFIGGLAEEHINGGVVGQTFWTILHDQFDRLQEGDRFYYLDRVDDFDFYELFVEEQKFSDIVARNTGLTDLPSHIFETTDKVPGNTNGVGDNDDDQDDDNDDDQDDDNDGDQDGNGDGHTDSLIVTIQDETPADGMVTAAEGEKLSANETFHTHENVSNIGYQWESSEDGSEGSWTPIDGATGSQFTPGKDDTGLLLRVALTLFFVDSVMEPLTAHSEETPPVAAAEPNDDTGGGQSNDQPGDDPSYGDDGNDSASGNHGDDIVEGTDADEVFYTGRGDDIVHAGDGDDDIYTDRGEDTVFGDGGSDIVFAGRSDDMVDGGYGDDVIYGGSGNDIIHGGKGNDTIYGGKGDDIIYGGDGDDDLFGGAGDDILFGDEGDDDLYGGAGDDILRGGLGDDDLYGGAGSDLFIYRPGDGNDAIMDFQADYDSLDLGGDDTAYTMSTTDYGMEYVFGDYSVLTVYSNSGHGSYNSGGGSDNSGSGSYNSGGSGSNSGSGSGNSGSGSYNSGGDHHHHDQDHYKPYDDGDFWCV